MFKAILFDFDYTLADASGGIVCGFDHACAVMGLPLMDHEGIRRGIGGTLKQIFEEAGGDPSQIDFDRFRELYREGSVPVIEKYTVFFDDIEESFKRLTRGGARLGVVTNKKASHVELTLSRDGLRKYIDVIIGSSDMPLPKPDPRGAVEAARLLGALPDETLFVGDSLYDMHTAMNAEMKFAAVLTGYAKRGDFDENVAYCIADSMAELVSFIGL